ncbi:hypothetical protein GJA_3819 [Janthinobacterium agaricidamnosum NBRC 102515 = DSM 9628]|uniref:Uncharacterized protein n=1 Tax=Janthinobacterium agaricidamnosum NBRC 102515 = DSM 9628 TaxID=1349767 RepID=W0VAR7_9BURK|nr:hypothetical protein GJA_3819 [Janthinobacterium agaricidamnosum NBRC 102515 = DSM 9628]
MAAWRLKQQRSGMQHRLKRKRMLQRLAYRNASALLARRHAWRAIKTPPDANAD